MPDRPYEALLSLNIGGASFQLDDYGVSFQPIVKEGKGRTGTKVELRGRGYVDGGAGAGSAAAMADGVTAASESFSVSGQNVVVTELGTLLVSLLAARFVDGGPHIDYELLGNLDGVRGVKKFQFVAYGEQKLGDGNDPDNSYTLRVTTGPDDVRKVDIDGEITGPGAAAWFTSRVLPEFTAAYPLSRWVPGHWMRRNFKGDKATYGISFEEIVRPYPDAGAGAAVDGDYTETVERDEQQRMVRRFEYDFLCVGDPQALADVLRPQPHDGIVSESINVTHHKGKRLRATFVILESGSSNDLLDFSQSFGRSDAFPTVTAATYPGVKPFLIRNNEEPAHFTQRGRAVGLRRFPKAPEPILPYLTGEPVIVYSHLTEWEWETTWEYQYASVDAVTYDVTKLARPAKPLFNQKARTGEA